MSDADGTKPVQEAARWLMEVIVEAFGPETAKALDEDLRAGSESAFRFLCGAATQIIARAPAGSLPEGFGKLPEVYWVQAEEIKVASNRPKRHH